MTPEFSKIIIVDDIPQNGTVIRFDVSEEERAALAERFDLLSLDSFKGEVGIKPWRRHGLIAECQFEANVVQACIATLEPIEARIKRKVTLHFLPPDMIERDAATAAKQEIIVDVQNEDPPEAIENGRIDLGEALSEELSISLDPYPKKPGAVFTGAKDIPAEVAEIKPNPFAALEKLKKKD
ncbi:MAG: YceD family protein [Parvibaculaceae bacterium]